MSGRSTVARGRAARLGRPRVSRTISDRRIPYEDPGDRLVSFDAPAIRIAEVARRLAISRAAAYRLVRSGELPGVRVGTAWRVLRVDFEAYLERIRKAAERRYRRLRD